MAATDSEKRIKFDWNGTEYPLEFDRDSVMQAERAFGISYEDLRSGRTYVMHDLFAAALIKHHPRMKAATIEALWAAMGDKAGLYRELALMYADTLAQTLEEPEEGKALAWKVV